MADTGLLPKLAEAMGKPLGVNFYEPILIRRNIKQGKVLGKEGVKLPGGGGVDTLATKNEARNIQGILTDKCGVEYGLRVEGEKEVWVSEHEKKNILYWKDEKRIVQMQFNGKKFKEKKKKKRGGGEASESRKATQMFLSRQEQKTLDFLDGGGGDYF